MLKDIHLNVVAWKSPGTGIIYAGTAVKDTGTETFKAVLLSIEEYDRLMAIAIAAEC